MPSRAFILESLESRALPAADFFLLPPVGSDAPFLLGWCDPDHPDEAIAPVAISGLSAGEIPAALVEPAEGPVVSLLTVSGNGAWASFHAIDTIHGITSPADGSIALATPDGAPILFPDPGTGSYEAALHDDGFVAVTVSADGFGYSFLADPSTGLAVDADPLADGVQPESWLNLPVVLSFGMPDEGIPPWLGLVPDLTGIAGIGLTEQPALLVTAGEAEYILAVDGNGISATLYVDADPLDGIRNFSAVGPTGGVALVDGAGQTLYFPDPSTTHYWSWIDAESGEIHVSYAAGGMVAGFRVSPETGLAIDADDAAHGTQPDYFWKDQLFSLVACDLPPMPELGDLPFDPVEFANGFMHYLFRGITDLFMSPEGGAAFGFIDAATATAPETMATLENPMLARALDKGLAISPSIMPDAPVVPGPTASFVVSGGRNPDGVTPFSAPSFEPKPSGVRRVVDRVAENIAEREEEPEIEDGSPLPAVPTGGALPAKSPDPEQPIDDIAAPETALWLPLAEDTLPADPVKASVVDANPIAGYWVVAAFMGGVTIASMPSGRTRDIEFSLRRQRKENLIDSCFGGFGI